VAAGHDFNGLLTSGELICCEFMHLRNASEFDFRTFSVTFDSRSGSHRLILGVSKAFKEEEGTTDLEADVETVLRRYSWRWSIEVTFHDTKQHLGIDEPQNRTRAAARGTAPTALLLYSLIVW
jgi:hypothetical protein